MFFAVPAPVAEVLLDQAPLATIHAAQPVGSGPVLEDVVRVFEEDAAKRIDELGHAIAADDAIRVFRAARALRASSVDLGALRLAAVSRQLENAGRLGTTTSAASLLREIHGCFPATRRALRSACRTFAV
ncbi:MAG: Hpt domain-containing protein [Rhodospirillales bacterium]|nr:Hpt domain-containing protein [Rhodospirillales bacterium]